MDDPQRERNATGPGRPVPLARLLAGEIAVGTLINIAFNLFFAWLVFYGRTPIGRNAVMLDTVPAAFLPALLMTFPVTWLMRKRIARRLTVTPAMMLPFALPKKLVLRAPAIALLALALVASPVVLLLWLCSGNDWNWGTMVWFKLAFSAFHAAIVTPIVVLAALSLDQHAPGSSLSGRERHRP